MAVSVSQLTPRRLRASRPAGKLGRPAPLALRALAIGLALLTLVPVVYLVVRASESGSDVIQILRRPRTLDVVRNSLILAGLVSAGSIVIGVPMAWLIERSDIPCRRLLATLSPLPLAVPSYVGALTFIAAFGPQGLLKDALASTLGVESIPAIYGLGGAALTLTLFSYPYVLLPARAALANLDPAYDEAARCLGLGQLATFWRSTVPQLRPAVVSGALLSALYAVSDFGVVTLLRYDTFTRAIYVQYRSSFNRSNAAVLALLLTILALAIVSAEMRMRGRARYYTVGSGVRRARRPVALGRWRWPVTALCGGVLGLSLGVPFGVLGWWLVRRPEGVRLTGRLAEATWHSIAVGALTAVAAGLIALPIAFLAVRYASRVGSVAEQISMAGYGLPGLVVALAFVFLGARYATGLYQTLPWMVLALAIRFLPQALSAQRAALLQVSPRVEEAARSLGRGSLRAMRDVTLPVARPGVAAGAVLVFLTVMKELPITLLLSPTGYRTLATEIWTAAGSGALSEAALPALILILIASAPTLLVHRRSEVQP